MMQKIDINKLDGENKRGETEQFFGQEQNF